MNIVLETDRLRIREFSLQDASFIIELLNSPGWLQYIAWTLPPTYVFEGMRALLIDHVFRADLMVWSLGINVVLFVASFAIFLALLRSAKHHGSLLGGGE